MNKSPLRRIHCEEGALWKLLEQGDGYLTRLSESRHLQAPQETEPYIMIHIGSLDKGRNF